MQVVGQGWIRMQGQGHHLLLQPGEVGAAWSLLQALWQGSAIPKPQGANLSQLLEVLSGKQMRAVTQFHMLWRDLVCIQVFVGASVPVPQIRHTNVFIQTVTNSTVPMTVIGCSLHIVVIFAELLLQKTIEATLADDLEF